MLQNTRSFPEPCGWMSTNFQLFLILLCHLRGFQGALYIPDQVRSTAFHFLIVYSKLVFSGVRVSQD